MEKKILELFATLLQVPENAVKDATRPEDLERWDSMQHLILVSGFEEEFCVEVDPEEAVGMYKDFATFRRVILEKLSTKG